MQAPSRGILLTGRLRKGPRRHASAMRRDGSALESKFPNSRPRMVASDQTGREGWKGGRIRAGSERAITDLDIRIPSGVPSTDGDLEGRSTDRPAVCPDLPRPARAATLPDPQGDRGL